MANDRLGAHMSPQNYSVCAKVLLGSSAYSRGRREPSRIFVGDASDGLCFHGVAMRRVTDKRFAVAHGARRVPPRPASSTIVSRSFHRERG